MLEIINCVKSEDVFFVHISRLYIAKEITRKLEDKAIEMPKIYMQTGKENENKIKQNIQEFKDNMKIYNLCTVENQRHKKKNGEEITYHG
jgi:ABC-type uncharacterized transport system substrate-binding protein